MPFAQSHQSFCGRSRFSINFEWYGAARHTAPVTKRPIAIQINISMQTPGRVIAGREKRLATGLGPGQRATKRKLKPRMPHRPNDANANKQYNDDQSSATPSAPPYRPITFKAHVASLSFLLEFATSSTKPLLATLYDSDACRAQFFAIVLQARKIGHRAIFGFNRLAEPSDVRAASCPLLRSAHF